MIKSLLPFSPSSPREIPPGQRRPVTHPQYPSQFAQTQRLSPIFQSLQSAMERKAVVLQQNVQGIDPEFVLVFEVAGSVSNFAIAVKNAGMEWLLDADTQFEPDEDFF